MTQMSIFDKISIERFNDDREYHYIDEKGKRRKHTSKQYKLHQFQKLTVLKGLTREQQLEEYEEWLVTQGFEVFDKYNYGYLNSLTEDNKKLYNNKSCAREFRKDIYAINVSEVLQKIDTGYGIAENREDAIKYLKKNYKAMWNRKKVLDKLLRKVNADGQQRLVFNMESGELNTFKEKGE